MSATPFEFELGDTTQGAPLELADTCDDDPYTLRLREGTPITATLVQQLNDLLVDDDAPGDVQWTPWLIALALVILIAHRALRGPPKSRPRSAA